jgi:DNA-binding NarL/FixJ family response regulator
LSIERGALKGETVRTRLLLADDELHFYQALSLWLEQIPDFAIVGVATHASQLLELLESTQPDILLLDWGLTDFHTETDKVKLIHTLRRSFPALHIIAISSVPGIHKQVLATGVHAFVSKTEPPDHLLDALQQNRAASEAGGSSEQVSGRKLSGTR